jgi:hypothetical protein
MVNFLDSRRDEVARLMSTEIARLCEIWLTNIPTQMDAWNAVTLSDRFSRPHAPPRPRRQS